MTQNRSSTTEEWAVWWHRTDDRGMDIPECVDRLTEAEARSLYSECLDRPELHFIRLMQRWIEHSRWEEMASRPVGGPL